MEKATEQLRALIFEKFRVLDEAGVEAISPSWLADRLYEDLDPHGITPQLIGESAILQFRQLAREICRQKHTESEARSEQGSLFDFQLQDRYPCSRKSENAEIEPAYVLRHCMTVKERRANSARLRSEGKAKFAHADAFDAETDVMISQGKLVEEELHG